MKKFSLALLVVVWVMAGHTLVSLAKEPASQQKAEKATVEKPQAKDAAAAKAQKEEATLKVVAGKGTASVIDLINTAPVRGLQFTVNGVKLTEIRTTDRCKGFLAKFNEENGIVIMVSLSDEEVAPGKGPVAEIVYQKAPSPGTEISLSGVKIVGRDRKQLNP